MLSSEQRKRWGLHTPETLRVRAQELGSSGYLINGLLPARSIGLLLGDSGLGKSPLMFQAGICVAAGVPFLGRATKKGCVVIADFENGLGDIHELLDRISGHVGLPEPPAEDLLLWSLNDCEQGYERSGHTLLDMLRDVRPTLVIIDSLGSYAPEAERENSSATYMLKELRALARDCGTSTLLVHHRRKQPRKSDESAGPLERANLRLWFQDSRGASSLVNGVDIRLGVDEPDLSAVGKDEVALVMRGYGRIRGEIGPFYLTREVDEDGDPVGYRRLVGAELLFNDDQQSALGKLARQFTFKEAKQAYGRGDQATSNFLNRSINFQVLRKVARGVYEKPEAHPGE
jgi:AAA domain